MVLLAGCGDLRLLNLAYALERPRRLPCGGGARRGTLALSAFCASLDVAVPVGYCGSVAPCFLPVALRASLALVMQPSLSGPRWLLFVVLHREAGRQAATSLLWLLLILPLVVVVLCCL